MTPMINKERSSNRIEACLKTDDADAHFSHSLSVGLNYGATRTRPPLIGREVSLEPDKNNRYSSEETQLTVILKVDSLCCKYVKV